MNIQIFGAKYCFETKKAERYFKERKIKYQYVDVVKFGLSKGEFASIKNAVGLKAMINERTKEYQGSNLHLVRTETVVSEILFNNPKIYRTPIVRNGKQATVGYAPDIWENWE